MKKLHLISNAHLDPVWQWEWEEGAAAAVSTFRAAAEFCEETAGYVFNHNEVILYKWIEEYEPQLFKRIQRLVQAGKWQIMGGWYLQPDCNMLSGESFVRQILLGKAYFREKFDAEPSTAINFDSFGHTQGLVQILQLAGYDSYIFMRPDEMEGLPAGDFVWKGFNNSSVTAHKIRGGYNTLMGKAREKIEGWLADNRDKNEGLVLWGVGNHGGGPSRIDLAQIDQLMKREIEFEIIHSTPENYFRDVAGQDLPSYEGDLNPRFVGCYTSMIRIKQKHRQLENELYMTEKMLSTAAMQGLLTYPSNELHDALSDLLTAQFHDILPGSSVQPAEEASLRLMEHGLEIVARLKARSFFALATGQPKANLQEYPILIYNPHPFAVKGVFECEFMLEDQNWQEAFSLPVVYQEGQPIPCQPEKEGSNLNLDWRKRVVFEAELAPSSMNRFDCRIEMLTHKPIPQLAEQNGCYRFETEELLVVVNTRTGFIDEYVVRGVPFLRPNAFAPLVMEDNEDPWRMDKASFTQVEGMFKLMNEEESGLFSGVKGALPAVRVIEDGDVRTVIEAVFTYNNSYLCQLYKLPKTGTELEVQLRVYWNEKDKMLKLSLPTQLSEGRFVGQTAFGVSSLNHGHEAVAQKWVAVEAPEQNLGLTCINNGIYGSDFVSGEVRLSLLRSAGYCAHPINDRPIMVQDRFLPRMDQGERCYTFWLNAGELADRRNRQDREALVHNERPYALSFFPSGEGERLESFLVLEDAVVQLSAFKKEERGENYIIRLFEPTGFGRSTVLSIPSLGIRQEIQLNGFECKTLRLSTSADTLTEAPLCEV
ncbi:hypothetical protein GCM10008018_53660 [Paenibacillus marchantiophytorum]|uniref:Glycoside hydrolase family 38 central domain-containing protein n=1 Tax=Paenibacillus marchantiophytorum TaxID=1619310 RepID=A0ABQ1F659_9BACL|nr:alpha-mannosidase [Paenibacillus marchantiophytorum]GGA00617.1 hypothetical protein GCM10008018_53660 [Paenibacillus marchantiophytorum]